MGVLEIVLNIQALAFVVGRFGLPGAMQRLWFDGEAHSRDGMVSAVFWSTMGISAAVALLFAGMALWFLGLFIVLPVLGHATWHLYRGAVVAT